MIVQGYGNQIHEQIRLLPVDEPITTAVVAAGLKSAFDMDIEAAKKIANVNLKRMADKGELTRVQKGVYGKVKETPFGRLTPNRDEMIAGLLLNDGEKTIGYITGPTLLNAIGLCSWMPRERHITTNNYRRRVPNDAAIRIYKPAVVINKENAPYFQALEAFGAIDRYPVDADKPGDILRRLLKNGSINNELLIWYARNHFGQKTLLKAIDIAIGGAQ